MYVVGFATEEEIKILQEQDWDVEDARRFGKVVGKEGDSLTLPPEHPKTRAVVVFVDASIYDLLRDRTDDPDDGPLDIEGHNKPLGGAGERHPPQEVVGYDARRAGKMMEFGKPKWPELEPDEELLRIVLLQTRLLGKDTTVEPYASYRDELEWRRTDKYYATLKKRSLSVEDVGQLRRQIDTLTKVFDEQKDVFESKIRTYLCSHKRADGSDYSATGAPITSDLRCHACRAQLG